MREALSILRGHYITEVANHTSPEMTGHLSTCGNIFPAPPAKDVQPAGLFYSVLLADSITKTRIVIASAQSGAGNRQRVQSDKPIVPSLFSARLRRTCRDATDHLLQRLFVSAGSAPSLVRSIFDPQHEHRRHPPQFVSEQGSGPAADTRTDAARRHPRALNALPDRHVSVASRAELIEQPVNQQEKRTTA